MVARRLHQANRDKLLSQKRSQIQKSFEHRPLLTVNERRKEKNKEKRERERTWAGLQMVFSLAQQD